MLQFFNPHLRSPYTYTHSSDTATHNVHFDIQLQHSLLKSLHIKNHLSINSTHTKWRSISLCPNKSNLIFQNVHLFLCIKFIYWAFYSILFLFFASSVATTIDLLTLLVDTSKSSSIKSYNSFGRSTMVQFLLISSAYIFFNNLITINQSAIYLIIHN